VTFFITLWKLFRWDDSPRPKRRTGRDSIELGYSGGSNNKGRADIVLQGGANKANEPSYVIVLRILILMAIVIIVQQKKVE
jgi:hypothetical protein